MKVSSISTNYQQNNTSFKARTVKVNALTKFVNTFSKAGRTANQQMKKSRKHMVKWMCTKRN